MSAAHPMDVAERPQLKTSDVQSAAQRKQRNSPVTFILRTVDLFRAGGTTKT